MPNLPVTDPRAVGERRKLRRNRQIKYPPHSVKTDGLGNIEDRPITERLDCFADPIEWLWGRDDKRRQWGDSEAQAFGCAGCPVPAFCGEVAWERISTSAELARLHSDWTSATNGIPVPEKFQHPTWKALVLACGAHNWTDVNRANLQKLEDDRLAAKRATSKRSSATARKRRKKPRQIPVEVIERIARYHEARVRQITVAKIGPNAELWIRNRSASRAVLVADAWQAREMLQRANRKASGTGILEWLHSQGRHREETSPHFVKRVEEALRIADQQIDEGKWPPFEPAAARGYGTNGMHESVVAEVLDE